MEDKNWRRYRIKTVVWGRTQKKNRSRNDFKIITKYFIGKEVIKMTKEQKIYCKIGQAVVNGLMLLGISGTFLAMFLLYIF